MKVRSINVHAGDAPFPGADWEQSALSYLSETLNPNRLNFTATAQAATARYQANPTPELSRTAQALAIWMLQYPNGVAAGTCLLESLASDGSSLARYNLARVKLRGDAVQQAAAVDILERLLAESPDDDDVRVGLYRTLGECLSAGVGTQPNHERAFHLLSLAAENGCPIAAATAGLYADAKVTGCTRRRDPELARRYYEQAAVTGNVVATCYLAALHLAECFAGAQPAKGRQMLISLHAEGHPEGRDFLEIYDEGYPIQSGKAAARQRQEAHKLALALASENNEEQSLIDAAYAGLRPYLADLSETADTDDLQFARAVRRRNCRIEREFPLGLAGFHSAVKLSERCMAYISGMSHSGSPRRHYLQLLPQIDSPEKRQLFASRLSTNASSVTRAGA